MERDSIHTGEKVAAVGGGFAVLGALLTWVNAGFISVSGIDGDGILTLLFGVFVLGVVVLRQWSVTDMLGTGVVGILTVLIASNVYSNLGGQTGEELVEVSAGGGLHLTMLAGILLVGAAAYGLIVERGA